MWKKCLLVSCLVLFLVACSKDPSGEQQSLDRLAVHEGERMQLNHQMKEQQAKYQPAEEPQAASVRVEERTLKQETFNNPPRETLQQNTEVPTQKEKVKERQHGQQVASLGHVQVQDHQASKQLQGDALHEISWDEFFDREDTTRPSERFWELSGQTVQIKGWMGEVLSIGQGWFLLVPAPGADCPFCSEDGNFWNKIMIVFVKDAKKLRHTNQQLTVTGRLDVGIKIDESNYKTMFRLYDATFETNE